MLRHLLSREDNCLCVKPTGIFPQRNISSFQRHITKGNCGDISTPKLLCYFCDISTQQIMSQNFWQKRACPLEYSLLLRNHILYAWNLTKITESKILRIWRGNFRVETYPENPCWNDGKFPPTVLPYLYNKNVLVTTCHRHSNISTYVFLLCVDIIITGKSVFLSPIVIG